MLNFSPCYYRIGVKYPARYGEGSGGYESHHCNRFIQRQHGFPGGRYGCRRRDFGRLIREAETLVYPLADGGEGTVQALVNGLSGKTGKGCGDGAAG